MTTQLVLVVMLAATIVRGILSLALVNSLSDSIIRKALEAKPKGQIMGIGFVVGLCGIAVTGGWVVLGLRLHQPLIVAIVGVNLAVSGLGRLIRWAAKQDAPASTRPVRA